VTAGVGAPRGAGRGVVEHGVLRGDWLHWLEPAECQWFWWDAVVEDPDTLRVIVEVAGWPAPPGALDWLTIIPSRDFYIQTATTVVLVHNVNLWALLSDRVTYPDTGGC